ncbi:hypothetical protein HDU81_003831 [Chytriomyces hyalinus]|nr:hypothetical protein HDU81_003831 [Chytriomyces hyalinus]
MLMALASGAESHYLMPMPLPLHVVVDTRFSPDAQVSAPVSPVDNGALSWIMDMTAGNNNRHESLSNSSLNFQLQQMQQLQRMQQPNQHLDLVLGAQQLQQQQQQQQLFQKSTLLQQTGYQSQQDQAQYPRLTGAQYGLYQQALHPFTPSIPSTSSAVEFRGIVSSTVRGASSPIFQSSTPSHQQASIPLPVYPNNISNSLRQSDASPSCTAHSDTNSPEQSVDQEFSPSPSGNDYESIFTRYLAVMSNSNASTTTTSSTTSNNSYPNAATGQSSTTPVEAKTYLRRPIQKDHKNILKRLFKKDPSPLPAQVRWIANELGIEKNKVKVWFQNQRAQLKRRQNVIALRPSKSI